MVWGWFQLLLHLFSNVTLVERKREVKNSLLRIDFREWPTTQFSSRKKTFTIDVNNVFLNLTFADRHFDLFNVELIFALSRRKNSLDFVLAFCLTFVFTFANLLKYFFRESNFREEYMYVIYYPENKLFFKEQSLWYVSLECSLRFFRQVCWSNFIKT